MKLCLIQRTHQTFLLQTIIFSKISASSLAENASETKEMLKEPWTTSSPPELQNFMKLE